MVFLTEAIDTGLLDGPLLDASSVALIAWFATNLACLVGLFWAIRMRPRSEPDVSIMLVTLNVVVFVVAYFMSALSIGIGFAFGLFALFGIMRYRTVTISLRHMSFLFAAIALAVVNALGPQGLALVDIVAMDLMIIAAIRIATGWRPQRVDGRCTIEYDRIDLLSPDRHDELVADVIDRTGLHVTFVDVRKVSLATGLAVLTVRYRDNVDHTVVPGRFEVNGLANDFNGDAADVLDTETGTTS